MKPFSSTSIPLASQALNENSMHHADYRRLHELRVKNLTGMAQHHGQKVEALEQHLASYSKLRHTAPKGTTGSRAIVLKRLHNEKELQQLALLRAEGARQDLEASRRHEAALLQEKSAPISIRLEPEASSPFEQPHPAAPSMEQVERLLQSHGYGAKDFLNKNERVRNMRTHHNYLDEVSRALDKLRNKVGQA